MKRSVLAATVFSLFGCIQAEVGSFAWYDAASREEKIAYFQEACVAYGFKPGTTDMATCIADENRNMQKQYSDFMAGMRARNASSMTTCNTYGTSTFCRTN